MKNPFKDTAQKLYDKGLSVIPLMENTKRPFITGWQKHCEEQIKDPLVYTSKTCNIGLCLGKQSEIVALDFDSNIDNKHEEIKKICGNSPVIKKGAKGCTMFFRFNNEKSSKYSINGDMVFEVLSTGNQTVIPPSIHPDTNLSYIYTSEKGLKDIDITELPYLPLDFKEQIDKLFGKDVKEKKAVDMKESDSSIEEVEEALTYISPYGYGVWLNIGMALRSYESEDLFYLWDVWSSKGNTYNATEMQGKWKSFKPNGGITIATIFKLAIENGYNKNDNNSIENNINMGSSSIDSCLYSVKDARKQIDYWKLHGYPRGDYIGIKEFELGKVNWHLRKKELTVVTGEPGSGKSEFVNFMIYKAAKKLGYKTLSCSFEESTDRLIEGFMTRHANKRMKDRSEAEDQEASKFIEDNFYFYNNLTGDNSLETMLNLCVKLKNKIDILVIDTFSKVRSQYGCSESDLNHVKRSVQMLSHACKKLNIHIFLVAHPSKSAVSNREANVKGVVRAPPSLYSVSGGAVFNNDADNGLVIERIGLTCQATFCKIRDQNYGDHTGSVKMTYNVNNRKFESHVEEGFEESPF